MNSEHICGNKDGLQAEKTIELPRRPLHIRSDAQSARNTTLRTGSNCRNQKTPYKVYSDPQNNGLFADFRVLTMCTASLKMPYTGYRDFYLA